jgi:hypothetical protein
MIGKDTEVSPAQVAELASVTKLRPTEDQFKGKPGYTRTYGADGSYEWQYEYKPNDNGKPTREGAEVAELLRPFQQADSERHSRQQARIERAALKDAEGQIHYVSAADADATAKRMGWKSQSRARGIRVERGTVGGMFFRWLNREWQPTGRIELGVLGKAASRRGLQFDPDGNSWRCVDGEWVRL